MATTASPGSVRIGSIYGISIELNWIFILMILVFVAIDPYLGLLWVLLFACVLIHELAHSVTALRNRISVSRIVLLPFGGASVMDTSKADPRTEFNIAIVGPLMSFFLGGVFGIITLVLPAGFVEQLVQLLFVLNMLLGVFNIIPAFPMDGGRIFRSYLERKRSLYDATAITARVTKVVLVLIMIATVGFILSVPQDPLSYKLFVFIFDLIIVVFIYGGMKAEESSVMIRKETEGVRIAEVASRHYALIDFDAAPSELYSLVKSTGKHVILTRNGRDYAVVNFGNGIKASRASRVGDISIQIPRIKASAGIAEGLDAVSNSPVGVAAVEKNGRLAGIITLAQVQSFISLYLMKKGVGKAAVQQ